MHARLCTSTPTDQHARRSHTLCASAHCSPHSSFLAATPHHHHPGRVQLARVMKRQERARESAIEKGEDFFRLAAHGSLSEMEELLREGIRLDAVDAIYGRTALMVAAASNSDDVVSAILNSIEDPKIDLRMTSPVRPIETPLCPLKWHARRPHLLALGPSAARGAGWLHAATLGCNEQSRGEGCTCGQTIAPVARRPVGSEQGGRPGARPRDALRKPRVGVHSGGRSLKESASRADRDLLIYHVEDVHAPRQSRHRQCIHQEDTVER